MLARTKQCVLGFIFVSLLGTLMHFLYDWAGKNPVIGIFSPVNESTWEHMKLLFVPMMVFIILFYRTFNDEPDTIQPYELGFGTLIGLVFIPVAFYTYSGVLGFSVTFINLMIYYVAVFLVFYCANWFSKRNEMHSRNSAVSGEISRWIIMTFIIFFAVLFVVFRFYPCNLGIFQNP